jgi:hypothetical protein
MKKSLIGVFSMFLAFALCWGAFPGAVTAMGEITTNNTATTPLDIDSLSVSDLNLLELSIRNDIDIAELYAYLDIAAVSPTAKDIILAARENIIFHNSWVTEGVVGWRYGSDGEIIEYLPQFSELFPGWDVPIQPIQVGLNVSPASLLAISALYTINIPAATSSNAPIFHQRYCKGFGVFVDALNGPSSCNIGIARLNDGYSLGFVENVPVGNGYGATIGYNADIGIRTSTWSTPGQGTFEILQY